VEDRKKKGRKFSFVDMNPIAVSATVARKRSDDLMAGRIVDIDLFAVDARYHRNCYQSYTSEKNVDSAVKKKCGVYDIYDRAAEQTYAFFENEVNSGNIILGPVICEKYKEFLKQEIHDDNAVISIRPQYIRSKLQDKFKDKLVFQSQPGNLPFLMCSENITVGQLYKQIQMTQAHTEEDEIATDINAKRHSNYDILKLASDIIISEVNDIPTDKDYPLDSEISLESYENFVQENLKCFMKMLIARNSASEIYQILTCFSVHPGTNSCAQYIFISIVFSSSRKWVGKQCLGVHDSCFLRGPMCA
jgi:hypothetical protein